VIKGPIDATIILEKGNVFRNDSIHGENGSLGFVEYVCKW